MTITEPRSTAPHPGVMPMVLLALCAAVGGAGVVSMGSHKPSVSALPQRFVTEHSEPVRIHLEHATGVAELELRVEYAGRSDQAAALRNFVAAAWPRATRQLQQHLLATPADLWRSPGRRHRLAAELRDLLATGVFAQAPGEGRIHDLLWTRFDFRPRSQVTRPRQPWRVATPWVQAAELPIYRWMQWYGLPAPPPWEAAAQEALLRGLEAQWWARGRPAQHESNK